MVLGMNSGRSGDGHRANTHPSKRDKHRDKDSTRHEPPPTQVITPPQPHKQHQPSAEQVHIARMLTDDRTPDDMQERVQQVQAVVDCPEESIFIALQDNEFDVGKACEALLDSNGSSKEEWTTMTTSKKSKKKLLTEQQSQQKKMTNPRGTPKAAAQHTRQGYGGSVTVSTLPNEDGDKRPNRGGDRGGDRRGGSGPRGKPVRRDKNEWNRKKTEGRGFEGRFPPRHHRQKPHEESWDKDNEDTSTATPVVTMTTDKDDNWDVEEEPPTVSPPPPSEEWVVVETPPMSFPDALGRHPYATQQQQQLQDEPSSSSPANEPLLLNEEQPEKSKVVKHRRFKASQIPDKPVEMPGGIEKLTYDMSVMGIDFGFETTPVTPPTCATPTTVEVTARVTSPLLDTQSFEQSSLNQQASASLLSTSFTDITDDPVIISSYKEKPPDNLEPPPGLVHPSQQQSSDKQAPPTQTSLLPPPPEPISLPPLTSPPTTSQAPPTSNLLSSSSIPSEGLIGTSGATVTAGTGSSFPVTGMGLHSTGNSSFAVSTPVSVVTVSSSAQQQSLFPSHTVTSGSVVPPSLSSSVVAPSPLSSTLSSANGVPVSRIQSSTTGHAPTATGHASSVTQQQQLPVTTGKVHSSSGNVHPMAATAGMVYPPHLLHQFPSPYGTTPVMMPPYSYDVESMNRYQGFFSQHPTSQDQGGGVSLAGGLGRDPQSGGGAAGTLSFGTDSKYDSVSTNPTQQQQQAQQGGIQQPHNQLNPAYFGHYPNPLLYTMYPPHMSMAAAATGYSAQQMAHKPTGATTYPVGTSYQPNPQYGNYEDVYALAKNNPVPSTTSGDFNAYSKHQFDSKANMHNSYLSMGTPMGGYMMGHHHVPPMGSTPIMAHDASSRSKSHKYATPTWPGPSTHS